VAGFNSFEEYEEWLRQQVIDPKRAKEIIEKGDAKVRSVARKRQVDKDIQELSNTLERVEYPKRSTEDKYKTVEVVDEYGEKRTKYIQIKSQKERLTEQLTAEVRHCGDLHIYKGRHHVVVPKEFFDIYGNLKPSKKADYQIIVGALDLLVAAEIE
jgi:vacuolar-type H+-ATPase subunit I/STV1